MRFAGKSAMIAGAGHRKGFCRGICRRRRDVFDSRRYELDGAEKTAMAIGEGAYAVFAQTFNVDGGQWMI
jgi:hypothetical protein